MQSRRALRPQRRHPAPKHRRRPRRRHERPPREADRHGRSREGHLPRINRVYEHGLTGRAKSEKNQFRFSFFCAIIYSCSGDIAQLGERCVRNAKVAGSNPVVSIEWIVFEASDTILFYANVSAIHILTSAPVRPKRTLHIGEPFIFALGASLHITSAAPAFRSPARAARALYTAGSRPL